MAETQKKKKNLTNSLGGQQSDQNQSHTGSNIKLRFSIFISLTLKTSTSLVSWNTDNKFITAVMLS